MDARKSPPVFWSKSLSARLLVLTVLFVLLAEAFIYVPSIARYRLVYLQDHMKSAHLAALALKAAPDFMVQQDLEDRLLEHADAFGVVLAENNQRRLVLSSTMPPKVDLSIDLTHTSWFSLIKDAFETLFNSENRILRVMGPSPRDETVALEVIINEAPLRMEMQDYSRRILNLSLMISFFTAVLIFLSLQWIMVRPIRNIAQKMSQFHEDPESDAGMVSPSERLDEIGQAERELATMQRQIRKMLRQKERLASIGAAVAKINHDLRNSLSKAMLVSDKLALSSDERVKQLAPQLASFVDQAIDLCSQTMDYVANSTPRLKIELFYVHDLIEEVFAHIEDLLGEGERLINTVDQMAEVEADPTQLRRVLVNLGKNALQMGASELEIKTATVPGFLYIDVIDNGPGLPEQARKNLFKPFEGSTRRGGTGLGLVIARDLLKANGGDLSLQDSSPEGTCFRLSLPV